MLALVPFGGHRFSGSESGWTWGLADGDNSSWSAGWAVCQAATTSLKQHPGPRGGWLASGWSPFSLAKEGHFWCVGLWSMPSVWLSPFTLFVSSFLPS